ncbi:hypothetical protein GCM10027445_15520 [Amycolatopsis endophytica]
MIEGGLGEVDTFGPRLRPDGEGAEQPLPTAAPEIQHGRAVARQSPVEQGGDRLITERRGDGMVGMGEARDQVTVHDVSLSIFARERT